MKAKDFAVVKRPTLAKVTKHPSIGFANYERRLESTQSFMQSIQQAYLGTHERAVVVLEGWDTAGKGGIVRRLGWALDPRSFKVGRLATFAILIEILGKGLHLKPRPLDPKVAEMAKQLFDLAVT